MTPPPWSRRLSCVGFSAAGTAAVVTLVLAMNSAPEGPPRNGQATAVRFEVAPPKKIPKAERKQKPKPRRTTKAPPPPIPLVSAGLSGLAFGLSHLAGSGLGRDVDALLGDVRDVVMTEDAVDEPPRPIHQTPPEYPARARKKGLSGSVTVTLLVGLDGAVQDARVLEARPPGTFDVAALDAVRTWRFEPAMYEGRPVAIRVVQTLRFGFEP